MSSNTAVPRYHGVFRDVVVRGDIPVRKEVAMETYWIDRLIESPSYYYDDRAVEGWIEFYKNKLTLTDGSDLHLLDTLKLWGEQVFGWYYFDDRSVYVPDPDDRGGHYVTKWIKQRLVKKQYLIVGRGAAKSLYDSYIQAYSCAVDGSTTHRIITAPATKQVEEVINPIRTAITRARGSVFQFMTEGPLQNITGSRANWVKLASTKKGIENSTSGSLAGIRPMSVDKLQGLRCKATTVDEWLFSADAREDVIGVVEQGASKLDDHLIIVTSFEGTVRNDAGDTIKMELMNILQDIGPPQEHVSIWWYKLGSVGEVAYPDMWPKANPNLGKTITYETYQKDVDRAETAPATRNDMLAKRSGLPMEGYTYYSTYEEILPHRWQRFWRMLCSMDADLFQGDDFCSLTLLFLLWDGPFDVKSHNYITSAALHKLPAAIRVKYEDFMTEGSLIVMEGTVLDTMQVCEDLDDHVINCGYDVRCFGCDPYNAKGSVEHWADENGSFGVEVIRQGARMESVPLGELKKLAGERMLLFDEDLIIFSMGNCIMMEDTSGNHKLLKKRSDQKIDTVAVMMDAYVAYKHSPEVFE